MGQIESSPQEVGAQRSPLVSPPRSPTASSSAPLPIFNPSVTSSSLPAASSAQRSSPVSRFRGRKLKFLTITWNEFIAHIADLNRRCKNVPDEENTFLFFALKRGSAENFAWKATVRICCLKVDATTLQVRSYRLMRLGEFLDSYETILSMVDKQGAAVPPAHTVIEQFGDDPIDAAATLAKSDHMLASQILAESACDDGKCSVCMDREPDTLLPCMHSFCLVCVLGWAERRLTFSCPLCNTPQQRPLEDAWVVPDAPDTQQIAGYLTSLGVTPPSR